MTDLLLGVTARARREPSPLGSCIGPVALTDRQTDTAPSPSAHLLAGGLRTVDAAASREQEPKPAPGGGVEGVGARGIARKLFVQLLGSSRSGVAEVCAAGGKPIGAGRSASSGLEKPGPEKRGEEEKEEERGPQWALGSQEPGSWTGEAAVCADSAPAARAPQAPARASVPEGRGARQGAQESGLPRSPSRRGSASRAGPGRASETMNFLLSWVHWTLALLLYLHHAKVSGRARLVSPGRGERLSRLGTCVRASARVGGFVPHAGPWAPGARRPPLSSYVEGEGVRARWEGARIVSPPTRALPTHQSHRTYDLGRAAEGGSQRRRLRGLGLRLGWRQKFAPGRGSRENWKSGQRGRESGAQRACLGGARTLDRGRAEIVEGAGRGRPRGLCCHCRSGLFGPCSEFEESFRMDCCGDPLPPL